MSKKNPYTIVRMQNDILHDFADLAEEAGMSEAAEELREEAGEDNREIEKAFKLWHSVKGSDGIDADWNAFVAGWNAKEASIKRVIQEGARCGETHELPDIRCHGLGLEPGK